MRSFHARALGAALLVALGAAPANAQSFTTIAIGQTKTKAAGTKADLYRFGAGSGTTITATLTAPGKSALMLYTPDGEEMLSAQGDGSVTLEAIIPLDEVFTIAVLREDSSKPYSLKLESDEADDVVAPSTKYVEVPGPNGTMRLSPEVVARNEAAAADHRRKLDEREQAVARAKSDHDRELARHAQSVATAAAEQRDYEQRVAANAAAHKAAMDSYNASATPKDRK